MEIGMEFIMAPYRDIDKLVVIVPKNHGNKPDFWRALDFLKCRNKAGQVIEKSFKTTSRTKGVIHGRVKRFD